LLYAGPGAVVVKLGKMSVSAPMVASVAREALTPSRPVDYTYVLRAKEVLSIEFDLRKLLGA
jgi:hypothetical protein